ncbi:hypothetical protein E3N88_12753 [Mikania micrantha]|uniref:Serine-threonine/tyrosine-protein kinase catalytic domain-containing protein n=1 Tax=Mikania micrantha TaxID=192012 RepID=A0A5N6P8G4_9ASTR|nr:hypothetical protein E3N88_12753 [Mikania micrantha]
MKESGNYNSNDDWWPKDDESYIERKKKRSRSRGSRGSVDWWLDGFSGELWRPRHNSHDSISGIYLKAVLGVLLLVLIAGRRPLQVTGSPMSEFQRANLLSWARHLALALLCLQKSPALRPSMKEVVAMLSGDLEPPPLPVEYSPSPPSRFKSHRKARDCCIENHIPRFIVKSTARNALQQ